MPVSKTATITEALPVLEIHASGIWICRKYHSCCQWGSLGIIPVDDAAHAGEAKTQDIMHAAKLMLTVLSQGVKKRCLNILEDLDNDNRGSLQYPPDLIYGRSPPDSIGTNP